MPPNEPVCSAWACRPGSGHGEAGVLRRASAEEDLVVGIVLREEAFELRLEARFGSAERLEDAERRHKTGTRGESGKRGAALVQEFADSPEHNASKDRGGDKTEDGQAE